MLNSVLGFRNRTVLYAFFPRVHVEYHVYMCKRSASKANNQNHFEKNSNRSEFDA